MNEQDNVFIDDFGGLAEAKKSDDQILRRFKRKSVAAQDWIEDLVKNGYRKLDKKAKRLRLAEEGLFMSDEMQDVGILSIAPSLSALLFEISLLREGDEVDKAAKSFTQILSENNNDLLNVIANSISKLIEECYPDGWDGNNEVLFSSTPFYDGISDDDTYVWAKAGYLDTASWVSLVADSIEVFLNRLSEYPDVYKKLKWKVSIGENAVEITTEKVRELIREIYIASINVTCDCIVKNSDGDVLGWTFRKMKNGRVEPSLYFSYVASTVYLGLYKRFSGSNNTIEKLRSFEEALCKKSKIDGFENLKETKFFEGFRSAEKLKGTVNWMKRNGFDKMAEFLLNLSAGELGELDLLYNVINKGKPLTYKIDEFDDEDGAFTMLKEATVALADTLWNKGFGTYRNKRPFKENMAKGPCFEDGSTVDMNVVKLSSHNNAFFNNLFVIGIILNSAYDVELEKKDRYEYEKMLNVFQLSIQNTQRCYDEIEDEGLLYKIDSYILDFSDKVDNDNIELAKQLRRVNMSVVPLMPLMLKNNNLMSQYVVKYPQKQMTDSLKDIIRNRKNKDGKTCWVWDKDGYNAITNYYYVDALISFYRYYEQYEEPLINNEENRRSQQNETAKVIEAQVNDALSKKDNEYKAELAKRDEYISEVRSITKGIAKLVINGLIDIVDEQLTTENLIGSLSSGERSNRDAIIEELNSFDKDSDIVKISKLVHLSEKLQVLSLLSMNKNQQVISFLKNGDPQKFDSHNDILNNVFGHSGDSSKFMRNLVVYLMNHLGGNNTNSEDGNND